MEPKANLRLVVQVVCLSMLTLKSSEALPMMRTAPMECPLENGNLLDVVLFATSNADCK